MKRVFFEKDNHKDYLFLIASPDSTDEVYKVNNFTDEMGREYVYTLVGERKTLNNDLLKKHIVSLSNGKFKNFCEGNELASPTECLESIIKSIGLNENDTIYLYVSDKK